VSTDPRPQTAREGTRTCAVNALAAVAAALGSLDRVARVVKVTGFLASDPGFTGQAGVLDGASDLRGRRPAGRGEGAGGHPARHPRLRAR